MDVVCSPLPRGSMSRFFCFQRHRYIRRITMIATPAILLTTLPTITGVGVAAAGLEVPFPSVAAVLDGDASDTTPVAPPTIRPSIPVDAGSQDELGSSVEVLKAPLDKLGVEDDMRAVRENLEVLLKMVELEKLLRDKLLGPEITG